MKTILPAILLLSASAALAQGSGRAALGEVWVYPVMFEQALRPLAPLSSRVMRENLCPNLKPDDKGLLYKYSLDAKMTSKGFKGSERLEVTDLKILNPSGCDQLDHEFLRQMKSAIPSFAEPRRDLDKNGWIRIPDIQLNVVE